MIRHRALALSVLLSAAAVIIGCGPRGPERVVVSGTVTYEGKAIADGRINFMPSEKSAVPMSGAVIKNGKYRVDAKGGVPVGTHKVEIEAYGGSPASGQILKPGARPQYLPKKFNLDSKLEITIEPGSGELTKDFELTE
ncbi:MAG: hypothetical protein JXM70_08025 [Pirellulales bacterium]|nr:hypothetical protein [Pirellulales bacterium]